jgi:hypothetical protein
MGSLSGSAMAFTAHTVATMDGRVTVALRAGGAGRPPPRGDASKLAALTAEAAGGGRAARDLSRDVRSRIPVVGLGARARRLGGLASEGRVRAARPRVRRRPGPSRRATRGGRARARRLARHWRERSRPGAPGDALQTRSSTTRRTARSRSGTASSCRRITSGSSGARATAVVCARCPRTSAASAGSSAGRTTCRSRASRSPSQAWRSTSHPPRTAATRGRQRSSTLRASRGRLSRRRATFSAHPPTRRTSRCARSSRASTSSAAAAARSSRQTAPTSRSPSTVRRGFCTPELDPAVLLAERQRFDPAGHYHRPDLFSLSLRERGA